MKQRLAAAIAAAAITAALIMPAVATAHRSGCHGHHSCPSDHATQVARQALRKAASDKRTKTFKRRFATAG